MPKCDICSKWGLLSEGGWCTISHRELKDSTALINRAVRLKASESALGRYALDDASEAQLFLLRTAWLAAIEQQFGESDWLLCPECRAVHGNASAQKEARPSEAGPDRSTQPSPSRLQEAEAAPVVMQRGSERAAQESSDQASGGDADQQWEKCRGCGRLILTTQWTCPHCGFTQWGMITGMLVFSGLCIVGAIMGYRSIEHGIWRHVVGWGAGILGFLILIFTISEIVTGLTAPKRYEESDDEDDDNTEEADDEVEEKASQSDEAHREIKRQATSKRRKKRSAGTPAHQECERMFARYRARRGEKDPEYEQFLTECLCIAGRSEAVRTGHLENEKIGDCQFRKSRVRKVAGSRFALRAEALFLAIACNPEEWKELREEVLAVLTEFGDKVSTQGAGQLTKLLDEEDADIRRCAIDALTKIDPAKLHPSKAPATGRAAPPVDDRPIPLAEQPAKSMVDVPKPSPARLRFNCPRCGKSNYAPASAAGKQVPCPSCKAPITIPGATQG